jgi:DNA-binding MarR family transcriptional regulator
LTDKAQPLVEQLQGLAATMAEEAFAGLPPATIATVREALARVRDNLNTPAVSPKRISA